TLLDLAKSEKPISMVRGAGRRLWGVGISEDGQVLGVQTERTERLDDPNKRGSGAWSRFELPRLIPTADESQKWGEPLPEADGWTIEPTSNRFVWLAVSKEPGVKPLVLPLDRGQDMAPTCFAFLPAEGTKPTRVIVGHYYGCSLFELTKEKVTQMRLFIGHA